MALLAVTQGRHRGLGGFLVFCRCLGCFLDRERDQLVQGLARFGHARDGRVPEHRLGPRGRHRDVAGFAGFRVDHRVAQVPEVTLHLVLVELVVGHSRVQVTVPVHEAVALEDQAVAEHREERVAHRARADFVHREPLSIPVTRAAHRLLLLDDALLVFVLPRPDALDESFATDVMARLPLELLHPLLDHGLRRDPGMVGARHPQGVVPDHAVPPRQQVLHDVVHRVAHVQRARDVGQRHHDDVAVLPGVGVSRERLGLEPALGDRAFDGGGFVLFWKFGLHRISVQQWN